MKLKWKQNENCCFYLDYLSIYSIYIYTSIHTSIHLKSRSTCQPNQAASVAQYHWEVLTKKLLLPGGNWTLQNSGPHQSVKTTDAASGCMDAKKRHICGNVPNILQDVCVHTSGSRPRLHQRAGLLSLTSHRTHTHDMHTHTHNLANFFHLCFEFSRFWFLCLCRRCCYSTVAGRLAPRLAGRLPPPPPLQQLCVHLTLRCGSVLGVYTWGKGVNATCFKEVQDVLTSPSNRHPG